MKRFWSVLVLTFFFFVSTAFADPTHSGGLTRAQNLQIRADVASHQDLNSKPRNDDGYAAMADLYNADAAPTFIVWATSLSLNDLGEAIDFTELDNLPSYKNAQLQTAILFGPMNPTLPNRRAFLNQLFVGQPNTLANLAADFRRTATRIESVLAKGGAGSVASPAALFFEGPIAGGDIANALAN